MAYVFYIWQIIYVIILKRLINLNSNGVLMYFLGNYLCKFDTNKIAVLADILITREILLWICIIIYINYFKKYDFFSHLYFDNKND